jgi:hypothetical protein
MRAIPKTIGMTSADFFPYRKAAMPTMPNISDANKAAGLGMGDDI